MSSADHELAVEAIQTSGNPLKFIVQSLQHWVSSLGVQVRLIWGDNTLLLQPNKERQTSQDVVAYGSLHQSSDRVPSKLIIPDIFCGQQSKTSNKLSVNGISTSSSNRWEQLVCKMLKSTSNCIMNFEYPIDSINLTLLARILIFLALRNTINVVMSAIFHIFNNSEVSLFCSRSESSLNIEPEFNERRHSESVVKSRNHLGQYLQVDVANLNRKRVNRSVPLLWMSL